VIFTFIFLILNIIQFALFCILAANTLYIFIFSIAGLFRLTNHNPKNYKLNKIALFIPGYKEDAVIIDTVENALKQDYLKEAFDIIVIADSFKKVTLDLLKGLPVQVIEVSFDVSTKSKALNTAMSYLPDNYYDIALILDADNILEQGFLSKINDTFNAGFFAVQGHRAAKNTNTSFAVLDAISEEINNHIFRKGHRILGLSSGLIGSGMAFYYSYFKDLMKNVKAVGGFDKEIELKMLREGKKIQYLENPLIFDEKVQVPEVFVKQRRRWLSAQLHYSIYFWESLRYLILKGNIDFFDKALQMVLLPRILILGLLPIITFFSLLFNPVVYTLAWAGLLLLCIVALLLAVPRKMYNLITLSAIIDLPKGFLLMSFSLLSSKGANKRFIHTQHSNK